MDGQADGSTDASTIAITCGITVLSRAKALPVMYPRLAGALKAFTSFQKYFDFFASTWCAWVHFDTISRKK